MSLPREGLRFTQAYANSPVCSPTRLALATGRYQYRLDAGLEEPIGGANAGACCRACRRRFRRCRR